MKDFGTLKAEFTACSICGSRNHTTEHHAALNDAAPQMLAALKALLGGIEEEVPGDSDDCNCSLCEAVRQARAALASAEGRE